LSFAVGIGWRLGVLRKWFEYEWAPRVYGGMRDDHLVGEGRLFEPDVMLPVQYFSVLRKQAPQGPEYMLVIAMLQDAIECVQKYRFAADENGRELFESAREWIASDDRKWPFSFENVCALLNLNPAYLRRGLALSAERPDEGRARAKVVPLKTPQPAIVAEPAVPAARAS
jgi:hypothetical protein